MIVVLDTTETFGNPRLCGPNFDLLEKYLSRTRSQLILPQIVVEETVNHYREQVAERIASATRALRELGRTLGESEVYPPPSIDQSKAIEDYRRYLEKRIQELTGSVIGYGNVQLPNLVARSLGRQRPFDNNGQRGFRDAILWESLLKEVISRLQADESVALVTKNSKDFGMEPDLFPELQEDCRSRGSPDAQVWLFNGLQSFLDREVKPNLEKMEGIHREIAKGQFKSFSLGAFFATFIESLHRDIEEIFQWHPDLGRRIPFFVEEFHSQRLHELQPLPLSSSVTHVWRVNNERIAVGIEANYMGEIAFQMRTKDYIQDGNQVLIQYKDEPFHMGGLFHVSITAILDEASGAVESHEVNDVDVDLGTEGGLAAW